MGQSADKVVSRLERARLDGESVYIRLKSPWQDNAKYGYVLALTEQWVVVHTLIHGFYLDDVTLFRLQDIKRVKRDPSPKLVDRAVSGLGVPVTTFAAERTATFSELLETIAARTELVMFYRHLTPEYLWTEVGKIRRVGTRYLEVHLIDGYGTWSEGSCPRRLNTIERVEFGGRYIEALELFGDPTPPDDANDEIARESL